MVTGVRLDLVEVFSSQPAACSIVLVRQSLDPIKPLKDYHQSTHRTD